MELQNLYNTVDALMVEGKGILAADESDATAGKRLALAKLENTLENRRSFRELMFTTPNLEEVVSGVILYDSTIRDTASVGVAFPDLLAARGIIPGIKVDKGTVSIPAYPGDVITEGLDGLADRLHEYYALGARFTKWRAVFTVDPSTSDDAIEANAVMLALYALQAQAAGMVPIVEPEVLFDGTHTIDDASRVTQEVLTRVCEKLEDYRVDLPGVILKTSMVLAGAAAERGSTPEEVADATVRVLHLAVPHTVGGIVFLSGGQAARSATQNLNAIAKLGKQPWRISSSFSRAVEEPMLKEWKGQDGNREQAQKALLFRTTMNGLAQKGMYDATKDVT